jgi:hypothetical protein
VTPERPVSYEAVFMMLVVLVGLMARGRWRLSFALPAYLASALTACFLVMGWQDRFYTRAFWMIVQAVLAILRLALVLEVAWRTFRVFPGAKAAARKALLAVIATTALAVSAAPTAINGWDSFQTALGHVHPLVLNGTIWMICVTLVAAHWFRVPIHPFHAAVLTSFAVYLGCFTSLIRFLVLGGFDELRAYVNALDGTAYLLLSCWWAYVAWRRETPGAAAYAQTLAKLALQAS